MNCFNNSNRTQLKDRKKLLLTKKAKYILIHNILLYAVLDTALCKILHTYIEHTAFKKQFCSTFCCYKCCQAALETVVFRHIMRPAHSSVQSSSSLWTNVMNYHSFSVQKHEGTCAVAMLSRCSSKVRFYSLHRFVSWMKDRTNENIMSFTEFRRGAQWRKIFMKLVT